MTLPSQLSEHKCLQLCATLFCSVSLKLNFEQRDQYSETRCRRPVKLHDTRLVYVARMFHVLAIPLYYLN
jgi:hypothetical protein